MADRWMKNAWYRLVTKRNAGEKLTDCERREWELLREIVRLTRIKKRYEKTMLYLDREILEMKLEKVERDMRPTP